MPSRAVSPWRARRVNIESFDVGSITVSSGDERWYLDRDEIQAIPTADLAATSDSGQADQPRGA